MRAGQLPLRTVLNTIADLRDLSCYRHLQTAVCLPPHIIDRPVVFVPAFDEVVSSSEEKRYAVDQDAPVHLG